MVLVIDRAGWHTSERVVIPEGIHLQPLPAYSPELQPAERLWALADEPLVNEHFDTLDDLEKVLARALLCFISNDAGNFCPHQLSLVAFY
ncbi:MAG: transposase [Brasilonema octagenarum HA4186-MV1]|nr:transposase [Brasilonema octagenarum HA4186-MV1]